MTENIVRLDIPPDHHPDVVKGDSPGAETGRAALSALYGTYGKINDTANRTTDMGRLAAAAQPFAEKAIDGAAKAMGTLEDRIAHYDAEIATAIAPKGSDTTAAEIRAHWSGRMEGGGGAKSLSALVTAVRGGDTLTTSAVLSVPAYLSGLSDEQQGMIRLQAAEAVAPEHVKYRAEAEAALAKVRRATEHFTTEVGAKLREWRDEDQRIIEEGLR